MPAAIAAPESLIYVPFSIPALLAALFARVAALLVTINRIPAIPYTAGEMQW